MISALFGLALGQDVPKLGLERLQQEAVIVRGLVKSDLSKSFLDSATKLKPIERRILWQNPETKKIFTDAEFQLLSKSNREGYEAHEYDESFYFNTAYGSPTIYELPFEQAAKFGFTDWRGKKVVDFGYGMIGQLQMMAHAGAQVHGIDVLPIFSKLYSWPGDTGAMGTGSVSIHTGQWPADRKLIDSVGRGIDLFVAKNVLKMGYIHPKRKANPNQLVDLGVSDQVFLKSLAGVMKPGGLVVIYNLSPAQAPVDKPYLPWADGEYPFDWGITKLAGFEILARDVKDDAAARALFLALGYDNGSGMEGLELDLFTHVTVLRKVK
ncbi:MAG: hypothetical protein ACKVQS_08465 [Fimbriimonadaceae bacterium]